jgi:hypothetical protein
MQLLTDVQKYKESRNSYGARDSDVALSTLWQTKETQSVAPASFGVFKSARD